MTLRNALLAILVIVIFLILIYPFVHAHAQHNHEQHHPTYQNWVNKADKGCCNNQDCGELADGSERSTPTGIEVRIEGEWCPVQSFHYLKKGNAPNWATSHVCVQKHYPSGDGYMTPALPSPVCARLLCYQPKPGT